MARSRSAARSGGKIHEQCCHGRIASSESQRAIVDADASQTARSITSRCSSAREKRDSGTPRSRGTSQAIALTCATCCGGKTARATRPRSILKTVNPLAGEATSPPPDDLGRAIEPRRDLDVAQPVGRVERQLGPLHHLVGQRVTRRPTLELGALLGAQDNLGGAASHHLTSSTNNRKPLPPIRPNLRPRPLRLRSRVQAVVLAYETGLIRPGESSARGTEEDTGR